MKLVFDIGGTRTRLALTDGKTLHDIQRYETDPGPKGIELLLEQIDDYLDGRTITAAAGGLPGQLIRESGRLIHAPNLPGWVGQRVERQIAQHLNLPVTIHNDAEVVGLGEAVFGAGKGHRIVVYITVSTGVNGSRIVDGVIEPSSRGFELGSQLVTGDDGKAHQLADLTEGASLERKYGRPAKELRDAKVWHKEAEYLADGLYNTILHWSPNIVVMGGSMMHDIDITEVATKLRQMPKVYDSWPPLVIGKLGDDGGLYGAMALLDKQ
jgi:glucokinase